jgi:ABC-2 type transport system ATP-binding protein
MMSFRRTPAQVRTQLSSHVVMELVGCVLIGWVVFGANSLPTTWANVAGYLVTAAHLLLGSAYWMSKRVQLARRSGRLPGLWFFRASRFILSGLLVATAPVVAAGMDAEPPALWLPGLGLWMLGVAEHVNYFYFQVMGLRGRWRRARAHFGIDLRMRVEAPPRKRGDHMAEQITDHRAMREGPELRVDAVDKVYGGRYALRGMSMTVSGGCTVALIGPNGAGKSTMLRVLLGLVRATRGAAMINGLPYRRLRDPARIVGASLEDFGAQPSQTGRDHLAVLAAAAGIGRERVARVLAEVDLTWAADRACGGYSLGMRQRLRTAQALLGDPAALILDEPTNGLDPEGIAWMRELIAARAARGDTILFSTHLLEEARRIADEIVAVADGRVVASTRMVDIPRGDVEAWYRTAISGGEHHASVAE